MDNGLSKHNFKTINFFSFDHGWGERALLRRGLFVFFACLLPFAASAAGARNHYIATQYWGWFGDGIHASTASWDAVTDGTPTAGAKYYSGDPAVAEKQLQQMKAAGINVVSFGWLNQKQEGPVWLDVNPDQAFQDGMMRAPSFKDVKFTISYDLASRAWLVDLAENGIHPTPGVKIDRIPGIEFYDPQMSATSSVPSFDFSLTSNGKYIYDELLSHDFDYLARNYFNQPNYLKIGGKNVVFIYATYTFNDGKNNADLTNGFARAFNRVRTEIYNKYGITLYLVGDFAKYNTTYWPNNPAGDSRTLSAPQDYKDWGYLQQFDAVGSWNNFQGLSYQSLGDYTDVARDINAQWRAVALSTQRSYVQGLAGNVKTAYGSNAARLDYIPALVFSFRSTDSSNRNMWSQAKDTSEVAKQVNMVKESRDASPLAEENSDMVYQVAWNQWGEGQMIESSVEDNSNPYPGKYGNRYLDAIKNTLSNPISIISNKANGAACSASAECASGICNGGVCVLSACKPKTCIQSGYSCGDWGDGCGAIVNCGACASGQTCANGICLSGCARHYSKKCDNDQLYWFNFCGAKEDLVQNCGISITTGNYRCSNNWTQKEVIVKGCSASACTSNSLWFNGVDCGASSQECQSGICAAGVRPADAAEDDAVLDNKTIAPLPLEKTTVQMSRQEILDQIAAVQSLIADLQKQLAAITGSPSPSANQSKTYSCAQITQNLFYGVNNDPQAVSCLQEVLQAQGYAVVVSGNYDLATKTAVAQFQQKYAREILTPYGLTKGSGNVGSQTQAKINEFIIGGQ